MNAIKQKIINKSVGGSRFTSVTPNIATALEKVPENVAEVIKSRTGFGYTMTIFVGPSQRRLVAVDDLEETHECHDPHLEHPDDYWQQQQMQQQMQFDEDQYYQNDNNPARPNSSSAGNDDDNSHGTGSASSGSASNGSGSNRSRSRNRRPQKPATATATILKNNAAVIRLPYSNMMVSILPQNALTALDKQRYKDIKFHTQVSGHDLKTLTVTRIDASAHRGWDFDLQLKAYYAKDSIGTHHKEFDFLFKNEESAVTIRLRPKQKLRCLPRALIFKEELVQLVNPAVDVIAKRTPVGRIQGTVKGMKSRIATSTGVGMSSSSSTHPHAMAEYLHVGKASGHTHVDMAIVTFGIGGNIGRPATPEGNRQPHTSPSRIIHLPLGEFGNKIIFKRGTCLATSADVQIVDSGHLLDSSLHSLVGYGDAFLVTGAAMKKIVLKDDQDSLAIADSCLIAFTQDVKSRVEVMDKFKGIILDKRQQVRYLTGPGIVWLNYYKNHVMGDLKMGWDSTHGIGIGAHSRPSSRNGGLSPPKIKRRNSHGNSSKSLGDDMSIISMDPSIRQMVDWENDDNFSVDESAIIGLEPVVEQVGDVPDDANDESRLEVVQEENDAAMDDESPGGNGNGNGNGHENRDGDGDRGEVHREGAEAVDADANAENSNDEEMDEVVSTEMDDRNGTDDNHDAKSASTVKQKNPKAKE